MWGDCSKAARNNNRFRSFGVFELGGGGIGDTILERVRGLDLILSAWGCFFALTVSDCLSL